MSDRRARVASAPGDVVPAVASRAAAEGRNWFPEFGSNRVRVDLLGTEVRPRCYLYRMELASGQLRRSIVVKVRHSQPHLRRQEAFADRPILAPVRTLPDRATARREYDGLRLIIDAVGEGDPPRFGVLRPLAWLPEQSAIVMDHVRQPTLAAALIRTNRFRLVRRERLDDTPWRNAGAWLRLFHDHRSQVLLPARAETAAQVGLLYQQFADFLQDRVGTQPFLRTLSSSGVEIARSTLPAALPLATGHGDFVANNVFTTPSGRITVFDPLPMWRVPVYQDLATLVVDLRTLPLQAVTWGLALPRLPLAGYATAVVDGYFGTDPVPRGALQAFQLLVLLDRWSAVVGKRVSGSAFRAAVRETRVRISSDFYHRETHRSFLELVGSPAAPGGHRL